MSFTVQEVRKTVGQTCPYPITFESTLWQFSCTVVLSEQKASYFERVSMPSVITWKCSCGARYRARCDNFDNSRLHRTLSILLTPGKRSLFGRSYRGADRVRFLADGIGPYGAHHQWRLARTIMGWKLSTEIRLRPPRMRPSTRVRRRMKIPAG